MNWNGREVITARLILMETTWYENLLENTNENSLSYIDKGNNIYYNNKIINNTYLHKK